MTVVVAGGHGQIALLLYGRLDQARGLIRNPDHAPDLEARGAVPVVCDMEAEADLARFVEGADAVVFAAGAGPGSGPERKRSVDLGAAVKLIDACRATGVGRYLMISALRAADPTSVPEEMRPYMEAKAAADEALRASGLDYTIIRPGRLTDDPPTGLVRVGSRIEYGEVTRADVADVLAACLGEPSTVGATFDLIGGETPIADALSALGR
jgi:uncharacterized protein YbjT (DUF2867 family)